MGNDGCGPSPFLSFVIGARALAPQNSPLTGGPAVMVHHDKDDGIEELVVLTVRGEDGQTAERRQWIRHKENGIPWDVEPEKLPSGLQQVPVGYQVLSAQVRKGKIVSWVSDEKIKRAKKREAELAKIAEERKNEREEKKSGRNSKRSSSNDNEDDDDEAAPPTRNRNDTTIDDLQDLMSPPSKKDLSNWGGSSIVKGPVPTTPTNNRGKSSTKSTSPKKRPQSAVPPVALGALTSSPPRNKSAKGALGSSSKLKSNAKHAPPLRQDSSWSVGRGSVASSRSAMHGGLGGVKALSHVRSPNSVMHRTKVAPPGVIERQNMLGGTVQQQASVETIWGGGGTSDDGMTVDSLAASTKYSKASMMGSPPISPPLCHNGNDGSGGVGHGHGYGGSPMYTNSSPVLDARSRRRLVDAMTSAPQSWNVSTQPRLAGGINARPTFENVYDSRSRLASGRQSVDPSSMANAVARRGQGPKPWETWKVKPRVPVREKAFDALGIAPDNDDEALRKELSPVVAPKPTSTPTRIQRPASAMARIGTRSPASPGFGRQSGQKSHISQFLLPYKNRDRHVPGKNHTPSHPPTRATSVGGAGSDSGSNTVSPRGPLASPTVADRSARGDGDDGGGIDTPSKQSSTFKSPVSSPVPKGLGTPQSSFKGASGVSASRQSSFKSS